MNLIEQLTEAGYKAQNDKIDPEVYGYGFYGVGYNNKQTKQEFKKGKQSVVFEVVKNGEAAPFNTITYLVDGQEVAKSYDGSLPRQEFLKSFLAGEANAEVKETSESSNSGYDAEAIWNPKGVKGHKPKVDLEEEKEEPAATPRGRKSTKADNDNNPDTQSVEAK